MDPFAGSKRQKPGFHPELFPGQDLFPFDGQVSRLEGLEVVVERTGIPPSGGPGERMGGRAEAQVRGVVPVFLVVAGSVLQPPDKIGDFIVNKPGILQHFRGGQEELKEFVLSGRGKIAPAIALCQGRIILQGQLVAGQVLGTKSDGLTQSIPP
jgi:hypothetical protein